MTEKEELEKLRKIFLHLNPEKFNGVYFICGEGGKKDEIGLPDKIMICPAYGTDIIEIYSKQSNKPD